jgi:hypothetical protein
VYKAVRVKVETERPELASKMTNNLGFVEILCMKFNSILRFRTALGIEFRESTIAITSKCTARAKTGE